VLKKLWTQKKAAQCRGNESQPMKSTAQKCPTAVQQLTSYPVVSRPHKPKPRKPRNSSSVDVVLEVRDARIPIATHHPQVAEWVVRRRYGAERVDMILPRSNCEVVRAEWFFFTNAQDGKGVAAVARRRRLELGQSTATRSRYVAPSGCSHWFPNQH